MSFVPPCFVLVGIIYAVSSVSVQLCVFLTLNRSFYPSTTSTRSVRADSSPWAIQALWSQNYDTEIPLHCNALTMHDLPSYWIRQVRHRNASNPDALTERKNNCCDSFSVWYVSHTVSPATFCLRHTICFSYCVYFLLLWFVFLLT